MYQLSFNSSVEITMFLTVACIVGILGHLSNGVPFENSRAPDDFKPYFDMKSVKDIEASEDHPLDQLDEDFQEKRVTKPKSHVSQEAIKDFEANLESQSIDYTQYFDSRIVGGTEAPEGYSPHMVALFVGYISKYFVCGGSIISDRHVLTAAHCITSFIDWDNELYNTFYGMVGSNTWHKGIRIEFKCFRNHPEYDPWLIKNDIGVLITKKRIPLGKRIAIIPLNFGWVDGGVTSYVTGWGTERLWGPTPDLLKKLTVWTLSPKQCQEKVDEIVAATGGWAPPVDRNLEICTLHSRGHGMCHGDSGSALVLEESRQQCGVVAWAFPCAIGAPDVYVRLYGVKEFIKNVLRSDCRHNNEDLTHHPLMKIINNNRDTDELDVSL